MTTDLFAPRDQVIARLRARVTKLEQDAAQAKADLDRYEEVVGELNEVNVGLQRQAARAEQVAQSAARDAAAALSHQLEAEAAIERVRALADRYEMWHEGGWSPASAALVATEFRAVLGQAQQPTTEAPTVTVHACPGPDDNGISPCCKRPPFEFRGERITRDPDKVTCPGPAQQPTDDYEATTGHQITCCAGFTDTCTCEQPTT
ncbi:hypothetical protein [Streptomyces sp. NBC_01789]|uniref:hypothetical protein n=1 Tax=Streptomyces sp. NBC_01789 TaxID=2975941 RepID=UPI0022575345|nr:hypothetical protein [Streptomyces sp. NBC_01789]MCX4450649.1 hypothetical protein [Streptomyces sp. NBC_01789]